MENSIYVEASSKSLIKYTEELCGDKVEIVKNEDSYIVVLSDGLGSGVKANILSTLTSKIISTMMYGGSSIEDTVETIVHTLPVCSVRHVAYSTFIILQIWLETGEAYLVEFDSPGCIFLRSGKVMHIDYTQREIYGRSIKEAKLSLKKDDVLLLLSDGVIYAGIGELLNLGWGWDHVSQYSAARFKSGKTAARIAAQLCETCSRLYVGRPGDDTTVAAVKIIDKRIVSLYSGPPVDMSKDAQLVADFMAIDGKRIVCGGTSAQIVSRELGVPLEPTIEYVDPNIPPVATIKDIDIVTEGVLTLKIVLDMLRLYAQTPTSIELLEKLDSRNGAARIAKMLVEECTHFNMFIGQKINPAHQNPDLPIDLSIKMIIMDEICEVMESMGKLVKKYIY